MSLNQYQPSIKLRASPDNTTRITNLILTAVRTQSNYQTAAESSERLIIRVITGRTPSLDGLSLHPKLDRQFPRAKP